MRSSRADRRGVWQINTSSAVLAYLQLKLCAFAGTLIRTAVKARDEKNPNLTYVTRSSFYPHNSSLDEPSGGLVLAVADNMQFYVFSRPKCLFVANTFLFGARWLPHHGRARRCGRAVDHPQRSEFTSRFRCTRRRSAAWTLLAIVHAGGRSAINAVARAFSPFWTLAPFASSFAQLLAIGLILGASCLAIPFGNSSFVVAIGHGPLAHNLGGS